MRPLALFTLTAVLLSSCVGPENTPPPPPSKPVAELPKPPAPAEPSRSIVQPQGAWLDWPLTSGSWVYRRDERGSIALYGTAGGDALLTLRCDKGRGAIFLSRAGAVATGMTVRTSSLMKTLSVQATGAQPPYVAAQIAPTDPILDAMAYSRGRIALEAGGLQNIAIPVWSEIGRIVEDCRA
jgi:hypothetical protein